VVPAALRYVPVTNPTGARATVYDVGRNVFGIDRTTGFSLRPFDNVGVQVRPRRAERRVHHQGQFLDLNERIGGYDQDANYVASRTVGDRGAIERMQQSGITFGGSGGIAVVRAVAGQSRVRRDGSGSPAARRRPRLLTAPQTTVNPGYRHAALIQFRD
jgi:hypothetical protein